VSGPAVGRFAGRAALLVLAIGALFAGVCGARSGVCLDAYRWEAGAGYAPSGQACDESAGVVAGTLFFGRAVGGAVVGRSGRTREDPNRTTVGLLTRRGLRSAAVLAVALCTLLGLALARRRVPVPVVPAGLPLPVAGLVIFALVLRLVPPGSVFDYDRAGVLWAGLALALADGVGRLLFGGMDAVRRRERGRPWTDTLSLWGADPEPAVREVTADERATQIRGALVALLGGLVVVEAVFGVQGLGETLKDLVVDRGGPDPLLLAGVLVSFGLIVLVIDALPIERITSRWAP